jgi:hypothetical protein
MVWRPECEFQWPIYTGELEVVRSQYPADPLSVRVFAAAVVPRSAPICAATAHAQADLIEPETRLSDLGNLQNVVGRVALNLLSDLKK